MTEANCAASFGVVILMGVAIICNIAGVFSQEWWIDASGKRYGIFTVITCTDGVCTLSSGSNEGWMVFAQVSGLTMFITLAGAILCYIVCVILSKPFFRVLTIGSLFVACTCSVLHTFVLIGYYRLISDAYDRRFLLPPDMVLYQTLPVGLTAIAGTFCVPAFICLIVQQTKQRNRAAEKEELARNYMAEKLGEAASNAIANRTVGQESLETGSQAASNASGDRMAEKESGSPSEYQTAENLIHVADDDSVVREVTVQIAEPENSDI